MLGTYISVEIEQEPVLMQMELLAKLKTQTMSTTTQ